MRPKSIIKFLDNQYFLLIFLWGVLTLININKAFHIDDSFYLKAAEYLQNNPAKPMSGLINWGDDPTPMYSHNQPPLFFYLIAVVSGLFGTGEIALHLFFSVFTFLALFFFQKITRVLSVQKPNTLLILFALCPATIINQNLMVDMPILAIILGVLYFLLRAKASGKLTDYAIAALLIGVGLLIKYSMLPLLVVLFILILINRDHTKLVVLIIPIGFLSLWSLWNYMEYGSIHIIDRPGGVIHVNKLWAFIIGLGSISTFLISFISGFSRSGITKVAVYSVLTLVTVSVILFYFQFIEEELYSQYLTVSFFITGFLVLVILTIEFVRFIRKDLSSFFSSNRFVVLLFLASISMFVILFGPFIATRHILLVVPFMLLFGSRLIDNAGVNINRLSIIATVLLGLLLGISDWKYADYYREQASSIVITGTENIWTVGHWGWQWYSKQNGMRQYNTNQSIVSEGDYFVYPVDISRQDINQNIELIVIDKKWQEADIFTLFSGKDFASLYNSGVSKPPWNLSMKPIDTIYICKVVMPGSNRFSKNY